MFEKVLEMILELVFGKFIKGIDSKNIKLALWSGEVNIQNVTLKDDVIKIIDIPLTLIYSKIGKIHVKIP